MNTQVTVTPSTTAVLAGGTFTVTIAINPAVAISGAQMNLIFNPKAVQAVSVAEGGLFKQGGLSTFFMAGTIDNVNGAVNNIVDVTLGPGTQVTTAGTFVTVTFTALTAGQTTAFNLAGLIVANAQAVAVPLASNLISQTTVVLPEDLNSDGIVNAADMAICAGLLGQTGSPGWIQADFLKAGVINVLDLILIGQNFGLA
jgi:molybdopterin-binding protein